MLYLIERRHEDGSLPEIAEAVMMATAWRTIAEGESIVFMKLRLLDRSDEMSLSDNFWQCFTR